MSVSARARRGPRRRGVAGAGIVFQDQFGGANGAAWSASWTSAASAGSFTQQGGYGQVVTGAAGAYNDKSMASSATATQSSGEVRADLLISDTSEYTVAVHAFTDGQVVNWSYVPIYGYSIDYIPVTGALRLRRSDNSALTSLGTATLTCVLNDVIHFALRPGTGAFVWKNANTRPSTPTIPSTDATYTSGRGGLGIQGGNAATAHTVKWDNFIMDSA